MATSKTEPLTPLDLLMPRTYIGALLTFRTDTSIDSVFKCLQHGLDSLVKQFPFLSGRVIPHSSSLENRYSDSNILLVDKGSIEASYESLSGRNMPPSDIPANVWPFAQAIDEETFHAGAPVFGASIFRFADGLGIGVCVSMHHNVVDGAGFAEVLNLWTRFINLDNIGEVEIGDRLVRLGKALESDLGHAATDPDTLFAKHTEYSREPPAFPGDFLSCTSMVLGISVPKVESIKKTLSQNHTTNTILSALVWAAITQSRLQRDPTLARKSTVLATAVNGRRRISPEFSTAEKPYFGNVVLYSMASIAVEDLVSTATDSLAQICEAIAASQAPTQIDARHIAEVHDLVTSVPDYRAIFPGWDIFDSRDLIITSWADLDIYGSDFGPGLGKPEFVRVPYNEADGVVIVLPRKRGEEEKIDVTVMIRRDDLEALEKSDIWV